MFEYKVNKSEIVKGLLQKVSVAISIFMQTLSILSSKKWKYWLKFLFGILSYLKSYILKITFDCGLWKMTILIKIVLKIALNTPAQKHWK